MDYRSKGDNEKKFTDIFYSDLIRNSQAELGRVYSLDGGLTPELITSLIFTKGNTLTGNMEHMHTLWLTLA